MTPLPDAQADAAVLLVSSQEADHSCLHRLLDQSRWRLRHARTLRGALRLLAEEPVAVLIGDAALPDDGWKGLLAATLALPCPPSVVISSHRADERLWAEVLNLGGYDVLLAPFEAGEVLRVLRSARHEYHRRLEPSLVTA